MLTDMCLTEYDPLREYDIDGIHTTETKLGINDQKRGRVAKLLKSNLNFKRLEFESQL